MSKTFKRVTAEVRDDKFKAIHRDLGFLTQTQLCVIESAVRGLKHQRAHNAEEQIKHELRKLLRPGDIVLDEVEDRYKVVSPVRKTGHFRLEVFPYERGRYRKERIETLHYFKCIRVLRRGKEIFNYELRFIEIVNGEED